MAEKLMADDLNCTESC